GNGSTTTAMPTTRSGSRNAPPKCRPGSCCADSARQPRRWPRPRPQQRRGHVLQDEITAQFAAVAEAQGEQVDEAVVLVEQLVLAVRAQPCLADDETVFALPRQLVQLHARLHVQVHQRL